MKKLEEIAKEGKIEVKGWKICEYSKECNNSKVKDIFYNICSEERFTKICPYVIDYKTSFGYHAYRNGRML
jgi:hypothetical protein